MYAANSSILYTAKKKLAGYWPGGGTPIHYLYGYVPPTGVVILKFLI